MQRWILGGLVVTSVAAIVSWLMVPTPQVVPLKNSPTRLGEELAEWNAKPEPVGWVFGRVVGYEGAERPLMGQGNSFQGRYVPAPGSNFGR